MGSRGTASAYSVPRMGTPTRERGAPSGPAPPHKLTWPADAGKRVCVCSPLQAGRYYIPVLFRGAKGGARGSVWSERTMVHAHTTQGHRPMRGRWGFRVCPRHAGGHTPDFQPRVLSIHFHFALLLFTLGCKQVRTFHSNVATAQGQAVHQHNANRGAEGFQATFPRTGAQTIFSELAGTLPENRMRKATCGNLGKRMRPRGRQATSQPASLHRLPPCIARACLVDGSASPRRRWVSEPPSLIDIGISTALDLRFSHCSFL